MSEISKVRVVSLFSHKTKKAKLLKNIDATVNAEEKIACLLYEGYVRQKGVGTITIAPYYSTDECPWTVYSVTDGIFSVEDERNNLIEGLNHELVGQLFEEYKAGKRKPVKQKEVYSFLKEAAAPNLTKYEINDLIYFSYKILPAFISDIGNHPNNYSKKVQEIYNIVYKGCNPNQIHYAMDMINYPAWLQPKGCITLQDPNNICKFNVGAEIDGKFVVKKFNYDRKSITKYGGVGFIELNSTLLEHYIYSLLQDAFKQYTNKNIDYKIMQVTENIGDYVYNLRGEDFRNNYITSHGHMKNPDEFIVDMTELLTFIQNGYKTDKRIDKNMIYEVINTLKTDKQLYNKYRSVANHTQSDVFWEWFDGRVSKNQKLFKNVPKN